MEEYYIGHYKFGPEAKPTFGIVMSEPYVKKLKLRKIKYLYVDATFSVTPIPFVQVFTVIGMADNDVPFEIGTAFMHGRSTAAYARVFEILKQRYPTLAPEHIMSDFESAIIRASKHQFPNARHSGCRFHFCQAINKRLDSKWPIIYFLTRHNGSTFFLTGSTLRHT